jgi:hypothetical protein
LDSTLPPGFLMKCTRRTQRPARLLVGVAFVNCGYAVSAHLRSRPFWRTCRFVDGLPTGVCTAKAVPFCHRTSQSSASIASSTECGHITDHGGCWTPECVKRRRYFNGGTRWAAALHRGRSMPVKKTQIGPPRPQAAPATRPARRDLGKPYQGTAELRRRPLFPDKPIAAAKSETKKTQAISGIGQGR